MKLSAKRKAVVLQKAHDVCSFFDENKHSWRQWEDWKKTYDISWPICEGLVAGRFDPNEDTERWVEELHAALVENGLLKAVKS